MSPLASLRTRQNKLHDAERKGRTLWMTAAVKDQRRCVAKLPPPHDTPCDLGGRLLPVVHNYPRQWVLGPEDLARGPMVEAPPERSVAPPVDISSEGRPLRGRHEIRERPTGALKIALKGNQRVAVCRRV